MSGRRTVNLNKEPFEGRVRRWTRKWVACDDKGVPLLQQQQQPSSKQLKLLRWVQTDERTAEAPARFRHITPVKDLSLVPGARLGELTAPPVVPVLAAADIVAPVAQPISQPVAAADTTGATTAQQQAQAMQSAAAVAAATVAVVDLTGSTGLPPAAALGVPAAPLGAAAGAAASAVATSLTIDIPTGPAATSAGVGSLSQPSPSGGISFGGPSSSQLIPLPHAAGTPTPMGSAPAAAATAAASDFTGGTDSAALGRLPNAGGFAASDYTGGTDSMDVDGMMGGTQSQGTTSMQRPGRSSGMFPGTGGGSVYGEEDEGDEDDELDMEGEEDDDDDEEGGGGLGGVVVVEEEEEEEEVIDDDDEDGLGGVGMDDEDDDDMPG